MATVTNIYVTDDDFKRLESLLAVTKRTKNVEALAEELARAITVPSKEIPEDVVTMNSTVRFLDDATAEESQVALVYPQDANVNEGKISVLAPVGSALLGLSVGQTIDWPVPTGKTRRLRLVGVIYQPEAAIRYDL